MALPKIDAPIYELEIPSTGSTIKYRPFLVKEEKILLMALDSEDEKEQVNAIKQTINNCCLDEINVEDLPMFDLEYLFLQLRAKSVGETVTLDIPCEKCKEKTEHIIDISKVVVYKDPDHTNKIEITETVGMMLNYPKIDIISLMGGETLGENHKSLDVLLDMIVECIDYLYDEDTTYSSGDSTKKELKEFILNLSQAQFDKINTFYETMPKLQHPFKVTCKNNKCKHKEERTIQGMQSFFG